MGRTLEVCITFQHLIEVFLLKATMKKIVAQLSVGLFNKLAPLSPFFYVGGAATDIPV